MYSLVKKNASCEKTTANIVTSKSDYLLISAAVQNIKSIK